MWGSAPFSLFNQGGKSWRSLPPNRRGGAGASLGALSGLPAPVGNLARRGFGGRSGRRCDGESTPLRCCHGLPISAPLPPRAVDRATLRWGPLTPHSPLPLGLDTFSVIICWVWGWILCAVHSDPDAPRGTLHCGAASTSTAVVVYKSSVSRAPPGPRPWGCLVVPFNLICCLRCLSSLYRSEERRVGKECLL